MASDEFLHQFCMVQVPELGQLFYLKSSGQLMRVAAEIVDDILIARTISRTKNLMTHIQPKQNLGTNVYGPTSFEFYWLKINKPWT